MNKSNSSRWSVIALALLLGVFSTLGPFTIDMYLPAFPEIAKDLNTSASLVQFSLTACLLGLGIGQLVVGPLSDAYGRRRPLLIGIIAYVIVSFACAYSPNIGTLIVLRFAQGFAASAGIVISRAIARDLYSGHELTKFFSLLLLVGNLGPLVAPIAGSGVLTFTTWPGVFLSLAILGVFLYLMTQFRLKESHPPEQRVSPNFKSQLRNYGLMLRNRKFVGYMLAQGILTGGVFAYVAATPFVYQNIYGVSPTMFSVLFASNGISLMIGSQIVGRISHRVPEQKLMVVGLWMALLSSIVVVGVTIAQGPLFALVIPLFFFVCSISITSTAAFPLAMESQSKNAGSAAALLGLVPFVLGGLVAPIVGIAGEDTAVPLGLTLMGTSLIAILTYFMLVRKNESS
ncbi:Bcr/CflA family multidrug efflux MFS transporter [Saccharibacillus kuerlensis]|uniref:Bcr/CflA family efflux transporter n=1 Tax=Saccharibacillus kuerlensis TaxID=459527 RepID=A0ABQ2LB66_9BACL|nr:Bcr/CflA family multidrug efflux MFS transporter [Saccharibacillus kuerlensis]GGO09013.1 putative MFS-type transporter YdgK [Saccharibacillus kuerlensis]